MKRFKVLTRVIAILVVLAFILTACGSGSAGPDEKGEKVTIKMGWWGEKARHDATIKAVDIWNNAHPEIQVETSFSGWDGYHEKLFTQFTGNNAPDIFQFSNDSYDDYVSKKLLTDVTAYVDNKFAGIDKNLWSDVTTNGKSYAIPGGNNGDSLVFNKTKLDELGLSYPTNDESWDTLFDRCVDVTKKGDLNKDGKNDIWGIFDPMDRDQPSVYNDYVRPFGLSIWTADMKGCNLNDPKVIEVLKKYARFHDAKVIVPPEITILDGQSYIGIGVIAYTISAISTFPSAVVQSTDKLGMVMAPKPPSGGEDLRAPYCTMLWGVNNSTKNKEAAVKFLSWFLTSPEAAETLGLVRGVSSSEAQRTALMDKLTPEESQMMDVTNKLAALDNTPYQEIPPNYAEFSAAYEQEMNRYLLDLISLETFLNKVAKDAGPILAQ